MNAITTSGLRKVYPKHKEAVRALDLTITQGELFALLGVNGAGKSTTIKMLCCLSTPTAGDAQLLGHSVRSDVMAVKDLISISPQETAVAPNLSVRENLELMSGLYGHPKQDARDNAAAIIRQLGFDSIAEDRAKTLSGGWKRRLSIAMALISQPKVLFLDEPTLGLDVLARRELWQVIRSLHGQVTILLTTHYLEEAEALADRIGIMTRGELTAVGTAAELKALAGTASFEEAFIRLATKEEAIS